MTTRRRGLTITETLVVIGLVPVLLALAGPLRRGSEHLPLAVPLDAQHNLRILHTALSCYAADWGDRQFTAVPDDLGVVGGSCGLYGQQLGCFPPMWAGRGCDLVMWASWNSCSQYSSSCNASNSAFSKPISFAPLLPWGVFRHPQLKALHDYVGGRFYDPVYFSGLDAKAYETAQPLFDVDCEYVPTESYIPVPSTYALSPAAMYHPDVLRAPSAGGFQHPDDLDWGYESPAVSQARYPDLKTWMIEHNWLRGAPGECNPDYEDPWGGYSPMCDPYLFNHGADARPAALFFDGSIRLLRTGDVAADDATILEQTGVDGLWSRDTPFGPDGYFGDLSFDGTNVSHHVFTTGGILGRDTLR